MRGRKPINDKLKSLRGTDQPCRMRGELLASDIDMMPPAPRWMGRTAKKYYNTVGLYLLTGKLVTPVDIGLLEMCCYEFGRYHDLTREMDKIPLYPMTFEQSMDYQRLRTAIKQSYDRWLKMSIELGMTPSSRLKFHVVKEEKDELQEIISKFS